MGKLILFVGAGGFIGSAARYVVYLLFTRYTSIAFPLGTLMVNIVGCFLIGVIYGLADRGNILSDEWRLFLATGICGGFTTFSAFAFENIQLIKQGAYLSFFGYTLGSVALGLGAVVLGMMMAKA